MKGLKDKRIIVAGGATGIGASLVERLVAEGARIVVADINVTALNASVAKLVAAGGKATAVPFDLADEDSIGRLVKQSVEALGGIDGVANTGADLSAATLGNDRDVQRMDGKIWERTLKVNLVGHALLINAVLPHMIKGGGGSIVSVSSGAAYMGGDEMPAYAASKAGLHALIRHVARAYGKHNIRCNGVSPGTVLTEGAKVNITETLMEYAKKVTALPRMGKPEDLASALAFMLSDESMWITGQVLSVNGGSHFRD